MGGDRSDSSAPPLDLPVFPEIELNDTNWGLCAGPRMVGSKGGVFLDFAGASRFVLIKPDVLLSRASRRLLEALKECTGVPELGWRGVGYGMHALTHFYRTLVRIA